MKRTSGMLRRFGMLTFLGLGLVSLMLPWQAQAGGLHVSIGLGLPLPVAVMPAPVYVQPAPVYVQPAPAYVQSAPVVVTEPYPGQAYYRGYYKHG
jgi:hypothetical protein